MYLYVPKSLKSKDKICILYILDKINKIKCCYAEMASIWHLHIYMESHAASVTIMELYNILIILSPVFITGKPLASDLLSSSQAFLHRTTIAINTFPIYIARA